MKYNRYGGYSNRNKRSYRKRSTIQRIAVVVAIIIMGSIVFVTFTKEGNKLEFEEELDYGEGDEYTVIKPSLKPEEEDGITNGTEDNNESNSNEANNSQQVNGQEENFEGKIQDMKNFAIVGNSAYEYFNFNETNALQYSKAIKEFASKVNDVTVYNMLVPTSMDIMVPTSVRSKLNTYSQKEAIDYIYNQLGKEVVPIPTFQKLIDHREEYLFYRSDHHWTSLGSYYAYEEFCELKNIKPITLNQFVKKDFGDFLGSYYRKSNMATVFKKKPDQMVVYEPKTKSSLTFVNSQGTEYQWQVITDVSKWNIESKYSTFIGGDNPYTEIHTDSKNKKNIVVVKESYGNAFVPYLVNHYNTIYVIDYRYWRGSLADLVRQKDVDEVLFLNTVSMTRNKFLIGQLSSICY